VISVEETLRSRAAQNKGSLIGYFPAGYPNVEESVKALVAMANNGCNILEIGVPYSDPVMDGPVIQQTSEAAIKNGIKNSDVFEIVAESSVPTYVMSYWNPIERYGVKKFASALAQSGGVGVITPDLTVEESQEWIAATDEFDIDRTYVVAPSSTDSRLKNVTKNCTGFVYAASLMGVTGARSVLSNDAKNLVSRIRAVSDLPISVGLGVSNSVQASEISEFADGVIVGSAFLKLLLDGRGPDAVGELAKDLSRGVRKRSN